MAVGAWVWKTKPKPLKPTQREPTQRDRRHGSRSDLDRSPPERTGASPVFTCRDSWPVWKGAVWQRTHGEACAWASGPSGRAPYGNVRMVTWSVWRSVCCIDQVLPRPHVLHDQAYAARDVHVSPCSAHTWARSKARFSKAVALLAGAPRELCASGLPLEAARARPCNAHG